MKKSDIVDTLLQHKNHIPVKNSVRVFAPANIALCKYWGKRDEELNLPVTSSLSISLGKKGTTTELRQSDTGRDIIVLNQTEMDPASEFCGRLAAFFDLLPPPRRFFHVNTQSSIPTAAGLASSASGFAAMAMALDQLFQWNLSPSRLSILARLGSGSACRSLWQGFVEWHAGTRPDGMDSFGEPLEEKWPDLCIGLLILSEKTKPVGSRAAMQRTVKTCPFYPAWPHKVSKDMSCLKASIKNHDFDLLGKTAESNALAMHATLLSTWPPVFYTLPETVTEMKKVWDLREQGLPIYFTQDAGPNLKLLFTEKHLKAVQDSFRTVEILQPFLE